MNKPRRPPRRQVDGVLLLDKPQGLTSNAALQKVRWLLNAAKGGHTGTLDPMATGLLPLCFGEATKFSSELLNADKVYRATFRFGITTDTADAEGAVLTTCPVNIDEARLQDALAGFVGCIEQIPPMYSALKRDGKPLYEYARQGIDVERAPRQVTIHSLELISFAGDEAVVDVACSKGTYVRTLAADVGAILSCGAHLSALRRTRIGRIRVEDSIPLAEIETLMPEARDTRLAPVDSLLTELAQATLSPADTSRVLHGQGVRWRGTTGERWRFVGDDGRFLGVGEISADGWLNPTRLIAFSERV